VNRGRRKKEMPCKAVLTAAWLLAVSPFAARNLQLL